MHLADLLSQLGWGTVETEVQLLKGRFRLDIVATNYVGIGATDKKGWVIECKRERPESLTELIYQVCAYRGAFSSTGKNPAEYGWGVSWPCREVSESDFSALKEANLSWIDSQYLTSEVATAENLRILRANMEANVRLESVLEKLRIAAENALSDYLSAKATLAVRKSATSIDEMIIKECTIATQEASKVLSTFGQKS